MLLENVILPQDSFVPLRLCESYFSVLFRAFRGQLSFISADNGQLNSSLDPAAGAQDDRFKRYHFAGIFRIVSHNQKTWAWFAAGFILTILYIPAKKMPGMKAETRDCSPRPPSSATG